MSHEIPRRVTIELSGVGDSVRHTHWQYMNDRGLQKKPRYRLQGAHVQNTENGFHDFPGLFNRVVIEQVRFSYTIHTLTTVWFIFHDFSGECELF